MSTHNQSHVPLHEDLRGRPILPDEADSNLDPITGEPGAHPVGTGLGAAGGALAGAAIGAVGGPVGMTAGALVGAVAGGLVGKEVAEKVDPTYGGRPEQHQIGTGIGGSAGALGGAAIGGVSRRSDRIGCGRGYRRRCRGARG